MRAEHNFSLKFNEWEPVVFDNAEHFRVVEFKGRGQRVSVRFEDLPSALRAADPLLRACVYAVTKSGRSIVLDRAQWPQWLERYNQLKGTDMAKAAKTRDRAEPETLYDEIIEGLTTFDSEFRAQGRKEASQPYMKRLLHKLYDMPEKEFLKLSEDVQNWYDVNAQRMKAGKAIEYPEGFEAGDEPEEEASSGVEEIAASQERKKKLATARKAKEAAKADPEDEDADDETGEGDADDEGEDGEDEPVDAAPARGRKRAAPDAPKPAGKAAKAGKAASGSNGTRKRGTGNVALIRDQVIKRPDWSVKQLQDWAEKREMEAKAGTIAATRLFTLQVIDAAKRAGKWAE